MRFCTGATVLARALRVDRSYLNLRDARRIDKHLRASSDGDDNRPRREKVDEASGARGASLATLCSPCEPGGCFLTVQEDWF